LPFPYTVAVAAAVAYLFAVYGFNGTEFSYVIFLQNNGILQQQNGETATEERQRNGGNRALVTVLERTEASTFDSDDDDDDTKTGGDTDQASEMEPGHRVSNFGQVGSDLGSMCQTRCLTRF